MSAVTKALSRSRAVYNTAHDNAYSLKAAGFMSLGSDGFNGMNQAREQSANRSRYGLLRGWVYAAINALASKGASQPVHVGKLLGTPPERTGPNTAKLYHLHRMPTSLESKASKEELEIIPGHPLQDSLEQPNTLQSRWQFTYSFISNLALTGWAYIVTDTGENGKQEFYSLPTTWVTPVHSEKGVFLEIKVKNPNNHQAKEETFKRGQFAVASFPNPADPLSAISPAQAQIRAIRIDDNIQTSQAVHFDNVVAPSVIITMGSNPHPDAATGSSGRPRLTPAQRRQVEGAIKKVMGGVHNYGGVAIIDGLIERIDKLNMAQNEIGWEKSEKSVRTRILSAFSVHPFILGEEMPGSYAQAYQVKEIFFEKVNTYLDMLSVLMSNFVKETETEKASAKKLKKTGKVMVWWEKLIAKDPTMEKATWEGARTRNDVTQNEFRAYMGLPPDEDKNEEVMNKSSAPHAQAIAVSVSKGELTPEQAQAIFKAMGIPDELAKEMAGEGQLESAKPPPPPGMGGPPGAMPGKPGKPGATPPKPGAAKPKPATEQEELTKAVEALEEAELLLKTPASMIADKILESVA